MAKIRELVSGVKTAFMPLGEGGRIALPKEFRKALNLAPGDTVVMELSEAEHEVRIVSHRQAIRQLQEEARKYNPQGRSLVDALIADRRAENAKDEQEAGASKERRRKPPGA